MKIPDFTLPELEYYHTFCNFVGDEETLFWLRGKQKLPLEQCAEILHCDITTVKNISRRVNSKMLRVTNSKHINEWIDKVYWKNILEN